MVIIIQECWLRCHLVWFYLNLFGFWKFLSIFYGFLSFFFFFLSFFNFFLHFLMIFNFLIAAPSLIYFLIAIALLLFFFTGSICSWSLIKGVSFVRITCKNLLTFSDNKSQTFFLLFLFCLHFLRSVRHEKFAASSFSRAFVYF